MVAVIPAQIRTECGSGQFQMQTITPMRLSGSGGNTEGLGRKIADGGTVTVLDRFNSAVGIDAPERKQPFSTHGIKAAPWGWRKRTSVSWEKC
jgi:hypothetical protein